MTLVVVTGTGTEVGKTFVTAAVARDLRARGIEVRARKPVQSYAVGDAHTDADVLAAATGESPEAVCPRHRWLAVSMAPPMAADALGLPPFTVADLVRELDVSPTGITLVEGAGGLLSPIASDGDCRTLIDACSPALVVLVADAGLGTINLVRLCVEALDPRHAVVVYLNRFDEHDNLHRRNVAWLGANGEAEIISDVRTLGGAVTRARRPRDRD